MISFNGILIILAVILVLWLIDKYVASGLRTLVRDWKKSHIIIRSFWVANVLMYVLVTTGMLFFMLRLGPMPLRATIMGLFVALLVPKLVLVALLLAEDATRWLRKAWSVVRRTKTKEETFLPSRRKFIAQIGFGLAAIPFGSILYGITRGKYDFTVHRTDVFIKDLPSVFDGFTITQLSDIHAGSFDDADAVKRGVDLANAQRSDLLVFTGDMVNNRAEELTPWLNIFKTLNADYGKYATLGNHDYGDYVSWPSPEAKAENLAWLQSMHAEMGFTMLNNAHTVISKNDAHLALVGVENWGLPPWPQKGDLKKALEGIEPAAPKILLSHDPTHFEGEVLQHASRIDLTLSGHTHGMQFGVEIPGFRWSPVQYRYPRWAGLYTENGRALYVNRGFGFIGLPGRVGIWPEITVITLRCG
ncbi:MAG TPA: metallophosphoesterase [bacterium]|nr:metallophosphoesterase [bacterium]HMW32734.1 metallophosphoesterase [bacterium]HMW35433.1 metallophosphoesterase [bacterium]HMY34550.1 metallophosphoesterase [bacterium]HMZ03321.1 metallophosphoesterase [bacterium]